MMAYMYNQTAEAEDGLALQLKTLIKVIRIRRLISIILTLVSIFIVFSVWEWSGHEPI